MQVAWQNGLTDLAMPFMIQFMKDYVGKVDTLMADRKENMEARKVCAPPFFPTLVKSDCDLQMHIISRT